MGEGQIIPTTLLLCTFPQPPGFSDPPTALLKYVGAIRAYTRVASRFPVASRALSLTYIYDLRMAAGRIWEIAAVTQRNKLSHVKLNNKC